MRQLLLDTETTGLDPKQGHRIIEIGVIEVVDRRLTGRHLHYRLDPERDIDFAATEVHGLTREDLRGKPRFADVAAEFVDFARGCEWIIHNAPFDVAFFDAEFDLCGFPRSTSIYGKLVDTLALARETFPGKRNNLDALCERFGISHAHRTLHGALLDSQLLGEVWLSMTRGQDSLLDDSVDGTAAANSAGGAAAGFDASGLVVVAVSDEDLQAHEAYLDGLDEAAGGQSLWRRLGAPVTDA
jgi:DNA polymerase-3 subunit epsilon